MRNNDYYIIMTEDKLDIVGTFLCFIVKNVKKQ